MQSRILPIGEFDPEAITNAIAEAEGVPVAPARPRASTTLAFDLNALPWRFWVRAGFFATIGVGAATGFAVVAAFMGWFFVLSIVGSLFGLGGHFPK